MRGQKPNVRLVGIYDALCREYDLLPGSLVGISVGKNLPFWEDVARLAG